MPLKINNLCFFKNPMIKKDKIEIYLFKKSSNIMILLSKNK